MRYFNIVSSVLLLLALCILTTDVALAVADPFEPYDIAIGPDGNVYALVSGNFSTMSHIFVFAPDGGVLRTIEGTADQIAFDAAGNLYASDARNGSVRKMDLNGTVTGTWNYTVKSDIVTMGMGVSPDGKLYVSQSYVRLPDNTTAGPELNGSRIIMLSENGTEQIVYSNDTGLPLGSAGMAIDANGTIYATSSTSSFKIIKPDGTARTIGHASSNDGAFNSITDISLGKDGYLYVAEYGNHRVQKLMTDGTFVTKWKGVGAEPFLYPRSPVVDTNGRVYVADPYNERIAWVTPEYTFGENLTDNLKGQGSTWGNVYQGTNYTTRLQEIKSEEPQNDDNAASTPGFSPIMSLAGICLAGVVLCLWRVNKRQ